MDDDLTRRTNAVDGRPVAGTGEPNHMLAPDDVATIPNGAMPPVDGAPRPVRDPEIDGAADLSSGELPDVLTDEERRARERATRRRILGGVRELAETLILALLFFLALRGVVQNFRVEGSSMVPSFLDGQYVLVNKAVYVHLDGGTLPGWVPFLGGGAGTPRYLFHPPERGAVIVFHPPPPNDPTRDFIKRIIGVPGDTVDVRDGTVYVNGAAISEPFIRQPTYPLNVRFAHYTLGPSQYYVMGDNRGDSSDSRVWGPVGPDAIVGRTWLVYWPLSAVRTAPNYPEPVPPPPPLPAAP